MYSVGLHDVGIMICDAHMGLHSARVHCTGLPMPECAMAVV
jgi:hypothetical protein